MNARRLWAAAAVVILVSGQTLGGAATARDVLSDEELDDARGGFLVAGTVAFEFGATVRTYEDGVLALQTQINWTQSGPQVAQTWDPSVTSSGVGLGPFSAGQVFQTASGATLIHDVSQGALLNVLMNSDSNHTFLQDTDVTLVLPGFDATQSQMALNATGLRLASDMAIGGVGALAH